MARERAEREKRRALARRDTENRRASTAEAYLRSRGLDASAVFSGTTTAFASASGAATGARSRRMPASTHTHTRPLPLPQTAQRTVIVAMQRAPWPLPCAPSWLAFRDGTWRDHLGIATLFVKVPYGLHTHS